VLLPKDSSLNVLHFKKFEKSIGVPKDQNDKKEVKIISQRLLLVSSENCIE
jgi:hypothetical protein